jgi:hypothetical protein
MNNLLSFQKWRSPRLSLEGAPLIYILWGFLEWDSEHLAPCPGEPGLSMAVENTKMGAGEPPGGHWIGALGVFFFPF